MSQANLGGDHGKKDQKQQEYFHNLKLELRQAHFNLGNDKPTYMSSNKSVLVEHDMNDKNNKADAHNICSKL